MKTLYTVDPYLNQIKQTTEEKRARERRRAFYPGLLPECFETEREAVDYILSRMDKNKAKLEKQIQDIERRRKAFVKRYGGKSE